MDWVLMGAVALGLLLLASLVWAHVKTQAALERLDDRMSHLLAGVSLLTDTTESALRDVAAEITRQGEVRDAARPRARAATQRRVTGAARRGRTVQDIAAAEGVSEGEVRLRLQLDKAAKERATDAAVR